MASYKDILNTFGGNTSYADRFQAAALQGDSSAMQSIANEYRQSLGGGTSSQPTQSTQSTQPTYTPTQTSQTTYNQPIQTQNSGVDYGNWDYGADTPDRQEEIMSNLNAAYEQDPSRFTDWATFASNFNYDYAGRSEMERETMRNWYSQFQQNQGMGGTGTGTGTGQTTRPIESQTPTDYNDINNTDYYLSQLVAGNQISGTGTALDAARLRYQNWKNLAGMTPMQIASAIQSGAINPVGQDMQDLMSFSPALYAQVQTAMQGYTTMEDINAVGAGIYNGLTGTETNGNYTNYDMTSNYADYVQNASIIKQYNESLYKKIEQLGGDTAAYVAIVASMLQNPSIQGSKNEVEDLEGEVRKIQEQIFTVGDSARAVLGSEAPEDLVSAYISQQTKQLQNQLRTAQNSLLVAQGKLDNQLTEVDLMIDALNNAITTERGGMPGTTTVNVVGGGTGGSGVSSAIGTAVASAQDTHNYQDDSSARLKQIADNLENYYKTNPELFNNRQDYNTFFKYNQRSAKQKQILDAYWLKYGKVWGFQQSPSKLTGAGVSAEQEDNLINAVKRDLVNGIVSFDATSMKKNYKQYGVQSWQAQTTKDLLQEIGKNCSWDELQSILQHTTNQEWKNTLINAFWSNPKVKTEIVAKVKKLGNGSTESQRKAINKYLSQFGLGEESWRTILASAGISEKNIKKILAL